MKRILIPLTLNPELLQDHGPGAALHALQGDTMGTSWSVKLVAQAAALPQLRLGIQRELDRVVAQMSHWEPQSDLSRYNRAAAGTWQALPAEFCEVLSCALQCAQDSGGAYDPTIGPLVDLWGFGPMLRRSAPPADDEIEAARACVGWSRVRLDADTRRAWQPGGIQLDLSSIAKGYGVDQVARYLQAAGVDHYLVEVGGELRGQGCKPDGQPWWVALERPSAELAETLIALHGLSVATSGDYRRYFESGGQRYAHTLDPRSGRPVTHALASVTVLHADCVQADALATVLSVLDPQEGYAHARQRDLAVLFVLHRGAGYEERMTPAFEALME